MSRLPMQDPYVGSSLVLDDPVGIKRDEQDFSSRESSPGTYAGPVVEPLQVYMRDVGQHPLLTADQEKELASAMCAGKEAETRLDQNLDDDERDQLMEVISTGRDAQEQLANCNLRLVVSQAKRHTNQGLGFLDLIQEGNLGLMRAVEKFDHTRGFKFSTYATWWIRQAMSRALADHSRTIRLPVHVVENLKKLKRKSKDLRSELGRDPSMLELALAMKVLEPEIAELVPSYIIETDAYHLEEDEDVAHALSKAVEQIKYMHGLDTDPVSLYSPIQHDEDSFYLDLLEDESVPEPSEIASHAIMKEQLNGVLGDLEERERNVLLYRYGLHDVDPQTLDRLGKRLKITRERVRQIEKEALRKLNEEGPREKLRDFVV